MKRIMTCLLLLCSTGTFATNSLLQGPVTGAIPSQNNINSIGIISNNTDVALVLGSTGAVYIIDIQDANTAEAAANTITSIPNFVTAKLDALTGKTVTVVDMVVNPHSKSVYVLGTAQDGSGTKNYVFKVKNNGANVTILNLDNSIYSKVSFTNNYFVNSIAWGDNRLYVSAGNFGLDAELDYMSPPFAHNSTFTKRMTSMFKSNWGGVYVTDAPLERMAYGVVKSKKRLAGVTTCAPGFSLDLAGLSGSGTLQVTEDFNVHQGMPSKVVLLNHDNKSWLYELHDLFSGSGTLYRIGEKYLDGSQVTANKYNTNAQELRNNSGGVAPGMTDNDLKSMGQFAGIAFWNDGRLLVLDPKNANGALRLLSVGTPTGIAETEDKRLRFTVYPNPSSTQLTLQLPEGTQSSTATIYTTDGRMVKSEVLKGTKPAISTSMLVPGNYTVTVVTADGSTGSMLFSVK